MTKEKMDDLMRRSFTYDAIDVLVETFPLSLIFAGPIFIIVGSFLVTAGVRTITGA